MASVVAQRDVALADREKILADLKSALAFKKQAHEDRRRAEELMKQSDRKQEEQKAAFELERVEYQKEIAQLKDFVNQARAESSAKDEEIKALTSIRNDMKAAYTQLEKDMGDMEENYKIHLIEIDARARMELMKEFKKGDHLNWKPDEVIEEYYLLFPDSTANEEGVHDEVRDEVPQGRPDQEDNSTINELRAHAVNQPGDKQSGGT